MVLLVDLDDELPAAHTSLAIRPGFPHAKPVHHSLVAAVEEDVRDEAPNTRPNPNINGFSAALSCYPIVTQLASQLDLNTLDNLARTCRQFRANLLEFHDQLVKQSLHCINETFGNNNHAATRGVEQAHYFPSARRYTTGKVGKCARDMVGECQRCGDVICRNCTIKPPSTPVIRARHRRLCRTCTKAPVALLTASKRPRTDSNASSPPPASDNPIDKSYFKSDNWPAFTASAFERTPCCCDSMVWLCQPCGQNLRNDDTVYIRAWSWRTRYRHYLGGVGTGAGEGNEGVECGRKAACLASKIVEHEVECDSQPLTGLDLSAPTRWSGTSYYAQEIEGIGGGFKMKAKKQVHVGACVKIHEDEKDKSITHLEREVNGQVRSWCSWCERVVLGEKDLSPAACAKPPSSSTVSSSSSST